jgi:hypothetical protein
MNPEMDRNVVLYLQIKTKFKFFEVKVVGIDIKTTVY